MGEHQIEWGDGPVTAGNLPPTSLDKPSDAEFAKEMRQVGKEHTTYRGTPDTEVIHSVADDLLCELLTRLGYTETVQAFHDLDKWYA